VHGVPDKDNFWADSHRTTVRGVRDSSGDTAGTPRSTDMETAEGHAGFMRQAMEHTEDIMSPTTNADLYCKHRVFRRLEGSGINRMKDLPGRLKFAVQ
jgi:hypothetical protein